MEQVDDSLNDMMASTLQGPSVMSDSGDASTPEDVDANITIMDPRGTQVIAVAGELPSFQYFITEQAKSMLALQELQNEVGALLEFRDLVMEAFPQLGQKLQAYGNAMQSQTTLSPSKWEPGIRVKRKLGQQLRGDADMLVPSLLPRYRSNSQGKASRSSEVSGSAINSAIQDSGFCTESSKDHSSAISSRSKSRETDDELFSLLDHIHNKGTRLKLEVEYLWGKMNRKGSSSFASTNKRRCKSLDDLILTNGTTRSFTFECAMRTAFLETELSGLKKERDLLLKKMSEIENEHRTNLTQTNQLLLELETISAEKRDLEERLQVAIHSETEINNRISDLHNNFLSRSHWRNVQTPLAKGQLMNLMQVFKENQATSAEETVGPHFLTSKDASSPQCVSKDSFYTPEHSPSSRNFGYPASEIDRPSNPVTRELFQAESHEKETKNKERESTSTSTSVATLASTKDFNETTTTTIGDIDAGSRLNHGASVNRPDILTGFQSGHLPPVKPSKQGGVTLSKEKVLSILNEYDPVTLQRFLLTLSYQIEALNAHLQRLSKSRAMIFQQLGKYKDENEDLKFRLKEKDIELEGTKAEKRELERVRNEKLCYSTSDLIANKCVSSEVRTSPVSDTVLMGEKSTGQNHCSSAKYADLREPSDRTKGSTSCRHSVSKIPLKTYSSSKLPTKVNSSGKKTLTSFKEYLVAGPPHGSCHSSCISYTSSSLSNK